MITLIGASGRSGAALARALLAERTPFTPVVRDAAKWAALGLPGVPRIAELGDAAALSAALEGAALVISTAHARHAPAILAAAPADAHFVLMGSTRRYSRWADAHGDGVHTLRCVGALHIGTDKDSIRLWYSHSTCCSMIDWVIM